ncbi:MAG: hypothetical protein N2512_00610, partial [Armatimonadetes bacterium]|nr:hypothetical protein [Armatimonadota bacterium]
MTEELLPAGLVAAFAIACKFVVDVAARLYLAAGGKDLPGWAKQPLCAAIGVAPTCQAKVDVFAGATGGPTALGYVLTGIVLAAMASEVAH